MIIDAVKDFIKACPLLEGGKINVNYLGEAPVKYTIDNVPAAPEIRRYADGGSLRQFVFVFASREYYDAETRENLEVARFYEEFSAWIEEQNERRNVPVLDTGLTALRFDVLSSGYLYKGNTNNARYQIQCRLIYEKEGVFFT